ncbi:hypothetical protein ACFC58_39760 [Kitasatospora purpeofusca]|uniref:hypothetical protein n=1 Tax=Kitasatospora purpeofusca TaxID=67352 RepID=UPI0035E3B7DA
MRHERVRRKLHCPGDRHTERAGCGGGDPVIDIQYAALPEFLGGPGAALAFAVGTATYRALRAGLKR